MEMSSTSRGQARNTPHQAISFLVQKGRMLKEKRCPVCHKRFTPKHRNQKYCSLLCRRYANRHGGKTYDGTPLLSDPNKEAIREFDCRQCGRHVRVTEVGDLRTKFCSQICENRYWKHSKQKMPGMAERFFQCKNCGIFVYVTSPSDRRTVFCNRQCSIHYFSKFGKYKKNKGKTKKFMKER